MSANQEVALFRLDGSMVASTIEAAIGAVGIHLPEAQSVLSEVDNPVIKTARLLTILENASDTLREKIINTTKVHVPEIVAPWVAPVMETQYHVHNRALAVASDFLPRYMVRAYTDGLEDLMPDIEISFIRGSRAKESLSRFRGEAIMGSVEGLATRLTSEGYPLGMVAAGSKNSVRTLSESKHPLVINSPKTLQVPGEHPYTARLDWKTSKPQLTHFAWPGHNADEYDLSDMDDLRDFTEEVAEAL